MANEFKKFFVLQHDMTDCGVACLSSILKYYGHSTSLENLRILSGTSSTGTTLLGLNEAAIKFGFIADGYEAQIQDLKKLTTPCILHVIIDNKYSHYIILWKHENEKFLISDPASGFKTLKESQLNEVWQSKRLLIIEKPVKSSTDINKKTSYGFKFSSFINVSKYFALVKNDIGTLTFSLILGMIISILGLSLAFYTQQLIDEILPTGESKKLLFSLSILGIILILKNLIELIRANNFVVYSSGFNKKQINRFFRKLVRLPKSFFDARKIGDLVSRMNDGTKIQDTITYLFREFIIELLFTISIVGFVCIFSIKLGIVLLSLIILFLLFSLKYNKVIIESQHDVMKSYANSESLFIDIIRGTDAIKIGGKESLFSEMANKTFSYFQNKILDLDKLKNKLSFYFETFGAITTIIIFGWAGFEYIAGRLQLGEMIAILQIILMVIPAVIGLSLSPFYFQEAKVALMRMDELTSIPPEFNNREEKKGHIKTLEKIQIEDLSFNFPGRLPLIEKFNFTAYRGEFTAIIGPTGSGKSTLFNILQKLYESTSGNIKVNSMDWQTIPTQEWRSMIGVVPQEVPIFNGSLFANITMEEKDEPDIIIEFLEKHGFDKYFKALPNEYNTLVGEIGINLSGGQKQLVGLARALYNNPQVVFLDEATSSMDNKTEEFVISLLRKLIISKKILVIFISHDEKLQKLADKAFYLK